MLKMHHDFLQSWRLPSARGMWKFFLKQFIVPVLKPCSQKRKRAPKGEKRAAMIGYFKIKPKASINTLGEVCDGKRI